MRAILSALAGSAALLLVSGVGAQQGAPAPQVAPPAPVALVGPVLRVVDSPDARPVPIVKADVRAVVNGPLSETTLTLTFRNDEGRVLEGELTFPLPEHATVSGYGLDVGGVIVEGVPVEKQQARVSYEKEVRKGIDPGFIEHVSGNNFRTRVYPIPANGTRTVRVQFVSELAVGRDGAASFQPIGWAQSFPDATVRIEVVGAATPALRGAPAESRFAQAGDRFVAEWSAKDTALNTIAVSVPKAPAWRVLVERRPQMLRTVEELERQNAAGVAAKPDEHYFLIQDAPARPPLRQPRAIIERIGVLWDASLSREKADHARELRLLSGLLSRLGDVRVDVIAFRDTPESPVSFDVKGGDATAVVDHLRKLTYDGGTNLSAVEALADNGDGKPGRAFFVMFSDGVSNLGPADADPRAEVPVYALSGEPTANHAVLRHLARQSGGNYVNLAETPADEAGLPEADAQVLDRIGNESFSLVSIEFDDKQVADVLPRPGEPIGGRLLVTGRLLAPEATVKLNYGFGKTVLHTETFTLRQADAVETGLVPRFWAQQRVAELSVFADRHAEELLRLGKEFVIVTPSTSLIVLETAEQYVEHRIVPPKSRAEVYAQFIEQIEQRRVALASTHEEKVRRALAMWDERVKWWEAEYDYPKDLVVRAEEPAKDAPLALARSGRVAAPRTAAPGNRPATPAGEPPTSEAAPEDRETSDQLNRAEPGSEEHAPASPAEMPADAVTSGPEVAAAQGRSDLRERLAERPDADDAPDFSLQQSADALNGGGGGGGGGLFGDNGGGRVGGTRDKGGEGQEGPAGPAIAIQPWDPDTPYLQAMRTAGPAEAYAVYVEQRKAFGTAPAFYLDSADYLLRNDRRDEGVRVLTSVAELHLEDSRLLRVVAHRLAQLGELDLAIAMFERIAKLRPEEPQSHRDLALALSDRADKRAAGPAETRSAGSAAGDCARALELLNKVVMDDWDRFEGVQVVALMEANRILAKLAATPNLGDVPVPLDARLRKLLDLDVRVVLTWDADATDIDLWVTEPSGEVCKYDHNRTTIGGLMSADFTQGYGPEEYCLRRLMPGQYKIQANFYGSGLQQIAGPTTVQATVITDFGRPTEKRQALTLRLSSASEIVDVGTVTLGQPAAKP